MFSPVLHMDSLNANCCHFSRAVRTFVVMLPCSDLIFLHSPLSYSMMVKPVCLEKELAEVASSPSSPTPVTPPPYSLSSPPHIECLRLFDTPQTPKSIIRRSSIMEVDTNGTTCSIKEVSARR